MSPAINITEIMRQAVELGACEKTGGISDWKTMSWLFFSPQGLEFCSKNNFPSIEIFRHIGREPLVINNIFVDEGNIERANDSNIALIGKTDAELIFDDPTKVHKVVVMHGAKVFITARNYAVVKVINIGDNKVVYNKDKTAVILR